MNLEKLLSTIVPLDEDTMKETSQRWDQIAKPLHSLGTLESALIQLSGISGSAQIELKKKALIVMCADNGVVEEGISQTGQEVTAIVSENFLTSQATASIMCRQVGAQIFPIDIGIARDTKLINKKVAYGTKNIKKGPAMTNEEVYQALETGISMVLKLKEEGYNIIATGEMGIGNTTTSSAIASVLLDVDPEVVTGVGAGLPKEGVQRKIAVIRQAIAVNHPDKNDPIEVLRTLGGLDIAGLTGVFLGGAIYRVPIIIDGMISGIAALLAGAIHPLCSSYQLASHLSKEPAGQMILSKLGKSPYITCDLSLGEGTGALSLFPLLDLALCVYNGMSTFKDHHIEQYRPFD